jgi:cyanophycinase
MAVRQLVIIGGAEERSGDCQILREFVRRAGGRSANIVVMTAATSEPDEAGKTYIEVFKRLGAATVEMVDTRDRQDSEKLDAVWAIARSTGIFFTGGDQARIVRAIRHTILDDAIRKRYEEGMVVGGTSAGAAIMPDKMIVDGDSETSPRADVVQMGEGMGFLPNVVIDQHFAQRGRLGRLLSALLLEPSVLGFGIDENTAMVVEGDEFEVTGEGAVTVVDESATTYNNLEKLLTNEPLAVFGVKLHILPQGYRFNLRSREALAK